MGLPIGQGSLVVASKPRPSPVSFILGLERGHDTSAEVCREDDTLQIWKMACSTYVLPPTVEGSPASMTLSNQSSVSVPDNKIKRDQPLQPMFGHLA